MTGQTNDSNQGTFLQKEEHRPPERFAGLLRRKIAGLLVLAGTLIIVAPAFSQSLSEINARAGTFFSQGSFKKAVAAYTDAIALNGNNAVLYYNRGLARFKLHDYASALDDFNKAVSIDPKNADLLNGRGGAYLVMQRFAEAIIEFDQALSIQPDNPASKENCKRAEDGFARTMLRLDRRPTADTVRLQYL